MENHFATKQDVADLRHEIWVLALEQKFIQLEQRLVIKLGIIVSIAIGVAVTLTKLVS